jgi:hypothetical protein
MRARVGYRASHMMLDVTAGARWLHLSNAGSEGRRQNPDIRSPGGFAGCGWCF